MITSDIRAMFLKYNNLYFEGKIPTDIPVIWNARLRTTAGYCRYQMGNFRYRPVQIELNPRLLDTEDKISETLIHEMVHAWETQVTGRASKHGCTFQGKMDQIIGYRRSHTYHHYDTKDLHEDRQIKMICPTHGVIGHRARMPAEYNLGRYYCKDCGARIVFKDARPPEKIRQKQRAGKLSIKIKL